MPNGVPHRAKVDRDVRGVGEQRALRVEHRAAVIEPFLDVDADSRSPQQLAHLVGDPLKPPGDDFDHHRVGHGDGNGLRGPT